MNRFRRIFTILLVGALVFCNTPSAFGAKVTSAKTNFTAGELAPRLLGRVDIAKYSNGAKKLENFLIHNAGSAIRRPGSKYVAEVKDSDKSTRLIDFQFSTSQAYILEIGEYYIRFYTDNGQVQSTTHAITGATAADPCVITSTDHPFQDGDSVVISTMAVGGMVELNGNTYVVANRTSTTYELTGIDSSLFAAYTSGGLATRSGALEIPTPYTEAQIFDIQYAQSADTAYVVHPSHEVMKLQRLSATSWTLTEVDIVRGPFIDDNITAITITPTSDTGATTLDSSAGDIFHFVTGVAAASQKLVGSLFEVTDGVVKIATVVSAIQATGTVQAEPDGTAGDLNTGPGAVTAWAEGAWSDYKGFPSCVTFHEQRLVFAASTSNPQTVWASVSQSFENFKAGANAADAFIYKIATEQVNYIRWLSSGAKGLQVGTSGSTFSFSSGSEDVPITPTSIVVKRDTTYGTSGTLPKRIDSFVYFVQRNLKTIRELGFSFDTDSQQALDMTLLAEHITGDGIIDMAYQQSPNNILWCVRSDGVLATLTRQIDQQVIGWARQISGSDSRGPGLYESVAVVPIDEGDDEVWTIVKRYINGSSVRFVEYFMPWDFTDQHDAFFVDSGLTLDSPKTITAATAASPVVVTAAGHGFSDGDQVKINDVLGMTDLNDEFYLVANKAATTFELTTLAGADVDGTDYDAYISGGEVRKMVTTLSGLDHLEGETVAVCADGGARPNNTVNSSGEITLASKAAVAHAGLPYIPIIQGLPLTDGSATGSGAGKVRRIYKVIIRFHKTLGAQFGTEDEQDPIVFRDSSVPLSQAPPLFTGVKEIDYSGGWDRLGEWYLTQNQPLPITVLYVMLLSEVNDE